MSPLTAPQFLETKSCSDCGDLASYGNYCPNCGRLLVQTTQPMSSAPQLNANNTKLPSITTRDVGRSANSGGPRSTDLPKSFAQAQRQTMVALPSPITPDTKHKHDMAYKVGNTQWEIVLHRRVYRVVSYYIKIKNEQLNAA